MKKQNTDDWAAGPSKSTRREKRLIRACEIVNRDAGIREIEKEMDALQDRLAEPWSDVQSW